MSGLDTPRFRIEVVGAIADILDGPKGNAFIGNGDDPTRGIGRKYKGLASEIFQSLEVREVNLWGIAFWQIGLQHLEALHVVLSASSCINASLPEYCHKQAFALRDTRDKAIDRGIETFKQ